MEKSKITGILKFTLKILLSLIAIYFVFKKVDFQKFMVTISSANIFYYLLALIAFNISKIISAFRLNNFYKAAGLKLDVIYNIKFYYVGMFYNLFLPGSIGGDAYKVYILRQSGEVRTRDLVSATLLDRLSGLVLLFVLTCPFIMLSSYQAPFPFFNWMLGLLVVIAIPAFYLFLSLFFKIFKQEFISTSNLSLLVQIGQVISAFFLLMALHVNSSYWDYLTLFMVSSVVAVVPLTLGGVGARELVMIFGYQYMKIDESIAVTFTLLFFSITAISSLGGLSFLHSIDKQPNAEIKEEVKV